MPNSDRKRNIPFFLLKQFYSPLVTMMLMMLETVRLLLHRQIQQATAF